MAAESLAEAATKYHFLSQQKYACRDKKIVVTNIFLSGQNFYRGKYLSRQIFAAKKLILLRTYV